MRKCNGAEMRSFLKWDLELDRGLRQSTCLNVDVNGVEHSHLPELISTESEMV